MILKTSRHQNILSRELGETAFLSDTTFSGEIFIPLLVDHGLGPRGGTCQLTAQLRTIVIMALGNKNRDREGVQAARYLVSSSWQKLCAVYSVQGKQEHPVKKHIPSHLNLRVLLQKKETTLKTPKGLLLDFGCRGIGTRAVSSGTNAAKNPPRRRLPGAGAGRNAVPGLGGVVAEHGEGQGLHVVDEEHPQGVGEGTETGSVGCFWDWLGGAGARLAGQSFPN